MTKLCLGGLLVIALSLVAAGKVAEEDNGDVNLVNAPPVVVKTVPEAGKDGIDPSLTEIKVTYSKAMKDKTWSWSTAGKDNFPEMVEGAKPHYLDDKRTCVLPVKLKPGKAYAIWLNSQNFGNFKDADGRPAVPYLLVFKTKAPRDASHGAERTGLDRN